MKVLLSILPLSFLATIWLGPEIAGGAQLLTDDDLDQVTAAGGTSWSVDILPTDLVLGQTSTPNVFQAPTALTSAQSAVFAAEASAEAARAVSGITGLAGATNALDTTVVALKDVSTVSGLNSINAGQATLTAAAAILNSVPPDQVNQAIIDAANKVNSATLSLGQTSIDTGAPYLNSAIEAVKAAKEAINGLPNFGGEADYGPAIDSVLNSIKFAKEAIDIAAKAQVASVGGTQTSYVLHQNGDGSLDPIMRISFKTGKTLGSADIIPLVTSGGVPRQPQLNLDGASIVNGTLPFTLIAETLMLNLNLCVGCIADTIIQNNNGYVVPIYAQ